MNRTTAFSAALAVLALAANPARAADEDVQLWLGETASATISPATVVMVELSQRFRDSGDQLLGRGTVEFRLSSVVAVGGGAAYVSTIGAADEVRPHQQLTLTYGPLALRARVEERFFEQAGRMELRLRQRISATLPVAQRLKASVSAELFYVARSQDKAGGAHVDSWRGNATLTRQLAAGLDGSAGYLTILSPRDGGPDKLSHVAQVSLTLRR